MLTLKNSLRAVVVSGFLCGLASFLIPNDACAQSQGGPAPMVIESVVAGPTTVHQGERNILVTVTIKNQTNGFYRIVAGGLNITGASISTDYTIRAVPGQNLVLVPQVSTPYQVMVSVHSDAPLGTATIDAHVAVRLVMGTLTNPSRIGVAAAVIKDSWDVVP